jgi:adenylosuccinate synthase
MLNKDVFARKLKRNLRDKIVLLEQYDKDIIRKIMQHDHLEKGVFWDRNNIFDNNEIIERYAEYGKRLSSFIADTDSLIKAALANGTKILLEGAQGHGLSIDYGTMPYVTSSDCSIPGLTKGAGLSERNVDLVIGVVKAPYKTRVGEGPFVTEIGGGKSAQWCADYKHTKEVEQEEYPNANINSKDEFIQGIGIRKAGGEYGATTGRPRRVGWLDLPWLRYAMQTNGYMIALTKMQVFDGAAKIKICDSYTYTGPDYNLAGRTLSKGDVLHTASTDLDVLKHCEPNYTTLPGWSERTENIKNFDRLPTNAKGLVSYIEEKTGARAGILSMGPDRSQTIVR